jgi:WD40 repeat protein
LFEEQRLIWISKAALRRLRSVPETLYGGHYAELTSVDIANVECSAWVFNELVYAYYGPSIPEEDGGPMLHKLAVGSKEAPTGFFGPVTSMCVREESGLVYLAGDVRVRAFRLGSLQNCETFFIGLADAKKEVPTQTCIAIWGNDLVMGSGNHLYFWTLSRNGQPLPEGDLRQYNYDVAEDMDQLSIDWSRGRVVNSVSLVDLVKVTSICVVDSCLVVASDEYPVIHIYRMGSDRTLEIVGRLITHTMGITSLCGCPRSAGKLISGSRDQAISVWDLRVFSSEIIFDRHIAPVGALCSGRTEAGHEFLFSGDDQGVVWVWQFSNPSWLFQIGSPSRSKMSVHSVHFSPDGPALSVLLMDRPVWSVPDPARRGCSQATLQTFYFGKREGEDVPPVVRGPEPGLQPQGDGGQEVVDKA